MTMLAGEREPLNSDFYVKWSSAGFRDVLGCWFVRRRVAWFSLLRSTSMRYDEADLRQMECCRRHGRRFDIDAWI